MRRQIYSVRDLIIPVIDFFYPPFRKLMDLQTFRYLACGGGNTVLGLLVYTITFKFILHEQNLYTRIYTFKPHVAALFVSFCVNFSVGFFLMKFVVFSNSSLKGRIQIIRYLAMCLFCLMLNYILLKIFVERFRIDPIISQVITTAIVITVSYVMQKHYTFKSTPAGEEIKNSD
jgi:hypothetical protein